MNKYVIFFILFLTASNLFSQNSDLEESIKSILKGKKATVGVSILFDDNTSLSINNDYHYPTMSVFKFYQALAVLDYLNKNQLPLETEVFVNKADLLPETHSPLRDKYPNGNINLSIKELLTYTISQSDNNACDILLKRLGGPQKVDQYVKSLHVKDVSIVATEAEMNETPENQYLNWTTPSAATSLLEIFLIKTLFSPVYKGFLETTMIETVTGANKIKSLLPKDAIVGHKTGSSSRNDFGIKIGENDLGFVRLPNGKQFIIGIFVMNSLEDDEINCSIIADISKVTYDYYNKNN